MRFLEDADLSFCLTVSQGIDKDYLLDTLGRVEDLPLPQAFDDFAHERHARGRKGVLNVFQEGDLLITVENNGFSGARRKIAKSVAAAMTGKPGHYACVHRSVGEDGYLYYAEVQDGLLLASFDPFIDDVPEVVEEFFLNGERTLVSLLNILEFRMEMAVNPDWLELPTETCVIDYLKRD